jgi:hypothetical protein
LCRAILRAERDAAMFISALSFWSGECMGHTSSLQGLCCTIVELWQVDSAGVRIALVVHPARTEQSDGWKASHGAEFLERHRS